MNIVPNESEMTPYRLCVSMWSDAESGRPVLVISRGLEGKPVVTMRWLLSPFQSVPYRVLQDLLATFSTVVYDAVVHRFGIQEDLESRDVTVFPLPPAESSPS